MASISRQIGWSNESNLLYQILNQLTRLTSIVFGLKPKYKVYTALLTQSGGDDPLSVGDNGTPLVIGVTYQITINGTQSADFTNVGAPNNDNGTYFVATGTIPASWGDGYTNLTYNTGAPVVTVLENTIGNFWFTYDAAGSYLINSNGLFINNKSWYTIFTGDLINNALYQEMFINSISLVSIQSFGDGVNANGILTNTPIEIRVYN